MFRLKVGQNKFAILHFATNTENQRKSGGFNPKNNVLGFVPLLYHYDEQQTTGFTG